MDPSRLTVLKPSSVNSSVYSPGGRPETGIGPSSPVTAVRVPLLADDRVARNNDGDAGQDGSRVVGDLAGDGAGRGPDGLPAASARPDSSVLPATTPRLRRGLAEHRFWIQRSKSELRASTKRRTVEQPWTPAGRSTR